MMRNLLLWLSLLLVPAHALAMERVTHVTLAPQGLDFSGPADSVTPGATIGYNWSATTTIQEVFWCGLIATCAKGTIQPSPSAVSSGMSVTINGQNHLIFETGVPGIGYVIGVRDYNGTTWTPLGMGISQSYPASGTSGYANNLGYAVKVTFIKTGVALKSGTYHVPMITAAIMAVYDSSGQSATANVYIRATNITVSATGCTVGTKSANIDLGDIDMRSLPTIGSTSPSGSFNVSLNCDQQIAVNAVMSDQSSPSNTSSVVTLTSDSTASGIGVQFFYNGKGPLNLGPDSSAAGTTNQFFIQTTTSQQSLSLPFQAQYVRTGTLVPGRANALASITFSYQ